MPGLLSFSQAVELDRQRLGNYIRPKTAEALASEEDVAMKGESNEEEEKYRELAKDDTNEVKGIQEAHRAELTDLMTSTPRRDDSRASFAQVPVSKNNGEKKRAGREAVRCLQWDRRHESRT